MSRTFRFPASLLRAALLCTPALIVFGTNQSSARVGVTTAADGEPRGQPPAEAERVLRIGIDVQAGEVITTGNDDRAHLVFLDGSSLTVGPNARLTIDKFVYDPAAKAGELNVTVSTGVLRLVGGRISKSKPIQINTPSASMGIRGGIALLDVANNKTTSTFVFGDKMTVTAQGRTQDVVRPGSQVVTTLGGLPSLPSIVVQGALNNTLAHLEARSRGAARGGPGNADRGAQNFGTQNSGRGTGASSGSGSGAPNTNNNSLVEAVSTTGDQNQKFIQQDVAPPPSTRVVVTQGRFLADPAYNNFNPSTLSVTPNASSNQLLASAGTPTNQQQITLGLGDGRSITLPWQTNTLTSGFSIGTFNDPTFGVVGGTGYVSGNGDFFAYVITNTSNQKLAFIGGTPTPSGGVPTSGVASYDITNYSSNGRLPFADGTVGDDVNLQASKVVSNLYAAFSSNNSATVGQAALGPARSTAMQATLSINGLGASQKSYMGVFIGEFFRDANNNSTYSSGGFSGSYRLNSTQQIGRLTSAASTPDVGGTNAIFGPSANAIVFTPDKLTTTVTTSGGLVTDVTTTRNSQASLNQPITNLPGTDYYSVNGATLTSTPSGVGQNRSSQTLQGYVGGVVEQQSSHSVTFSTRTFGTAGALPSNVTLTTDAASNRAAATIIVEQWDGDKAAATFQLGGTSGVNANTSSFVDNGTYALRDRNSADFPSGTTTSVTSQGITTIGTGVASQTTMVSYNTAPTANLFAASGVTPCTCEFLSWGWWSGNVNYSNTSSYNAGGVDRLNLASYVVGTVTPYAQLPNTGVATYNGHMVGNVANGLNSYVAAGSYSNTWSFASGTGVVTAKYDGATFGGGVTANTILSGNNTTNFANISPIPSSGIAGRSLSLSGSFFSGGSGNPVAGQAGSFAISGAGYKAGGIFAAQK